MSDNLPPRGKGSYKFVNAYLQKKEKEAIRLMDASPADFAQALSAFMLAGYKVSLSFDPANDTHLVSFTGNSTTPAPDQFKAITFRHREFSIILSIVVYAARQASEQSSLSRCFDPNEDSTW